MEYDGIWVMPLVWQGLTRPPSQLPAKAHWLSDRTRVLHEHIHLKARQIFPTRVLHAKSALSFCSSRRTSLWSICKFGEVASAIGLSWLGVEVKAILKSKSIIEFRAVVIAPHLEVENLIAIQQKIFRQKLCVVNAAFASLETALGTKSATRIQVQRAKNWKKKHTHEPHLCQVSRTLSWIDFIIESWLQALKIIERPESKILMMSLHLGHKANQSTVLYWESGNKTQRKGGGKGKGDSKALMQLTQCIRAVTFHWAHPQRDAWNPSGSKCCRRTCQAMCTTMAQENMHSH